jgi:hypothetical protein
MMQPSAGSYLGCENLTLEESRVKTDVRPPICFLMSKNNGEGSGIWTCEEHLLVVSFPFIGTGFPSVLEFLEIGDDGNW